MRRLLWMAGLAAILMMVAGQVYAAGLVTKPYDIKYADVEGVAKTLSGMVDKPGSVCVNKEAGTVIVTAPSDQLSAIDTVVQRIDRRTPQVLVEVRIYEIKVDNEFALGVDWLIANRSSISSATRGLNQTTIAATGLSSTSGPGATARWGFIRGSTNFNVVLRMLEENMGNDLIANPRLLVLDNVTAEIKIVKEVPYQQLTNTASGGQLDTTAFQEAGVKLMVTPHVADENLVRLHLRPDLSRLIGFVEDQSYYEYEPSVTGVRPIFDRRVADTTLLVKDGDTVVLGGLRRKSKYSYYARNPFFGHIPCIGWLFRSKVTEDCQTELVIFVTPRVVKDNVLNEREQKMLGETELDEVRGQKKIHYLDLHGGIGYGPCPVGPKL